MVLLSGSVATPESGEWSKHDPICFGFGPFDRPLCFCRRRKGASLQTATCHRSSQPRCGPTLSAGPPRSDPKLRRSIQAWQRIGAGMPPAYVCIVSYPAILAVRFTRAGGLRADGSTRPASLLLSPGAVSCCRCLSRCSWSASKNLAAHRCSNLLSRSRGIVHITKAPGLRSPPVQRP